MARPGRDQTAPMERLVRVIGVLNQHPDGAPTALLLQAVAPDTGDDEARRKMLTRDLDGLNALGYDIRNVADPGAEGVYVMRAHDNRLQVHLSSEQRGELLRAAILAGLEGMEAHLGSGSTGGPPLAPASADLDLVQRATARRCLVRFGYKGEPRVVHPARVHSGPSGWYLSGREDGGDVVKEFVVSRMSDVTLEAPGTAETVDEPARPALDPLRWEVDPPTDVVIELPDEHRVLVENLLGTPESAEAAHGALRLSYVVTNRQVFRTRVFELGTRVRIVSPDDVRAELVAELEAFVESVR